MPMNEYFLSCGAGNYVTMLAVKPSLCESCRHMRPVVTPKGSRFLLCELAATDERFVKSPPQPVVRCTGYEPPAEVKLESRPTV